MQQVRFNYSLKNIGLSNNDDYRRNIIDKTQSFIQRMRWKTHYFLRQPDTTRQRNNYGLKSKSSAPFIAELKPFEDDVAKMIETIKFRDVNDNFMHELERDKRKIKSSTNIFVPADKTRNFYKMSPTDYQKLLAENVTKSYKHAQETTATDLETELKTLADELEISNRINPMTETPAFITLKDHKPDFENHPKCRLINPAKSELGKVSKFILDKINTRIREQTHANQWRNSTDAISWFESIPDKNRKSFISFDIVDFYPSISEQLLDRAIEWAQQYAVISEHDIRIIKHARKSLLFHNKHAWVKRDSMNAFDVTMGSYDGAEICELVGLFILSNLKEKFGSNIGLYRDDGLAVLNTKSGRLSDNARKEITQVFDNLGLKITAHANQLTTNFLDLTFDLTNGTYRPYRKPNDEPLFINRLSNHPPAVIRQLPSSVNTRINSLSCNRETFDNAAPLYNNALRQSNFETTLTYEQPSTNSTRRRRQRNVIWYNPPYSKNVETNIQRNFLKLIDKHFPPNNRLSTLFNRHTVRVSYSCTENMKSFLDRHNKTVLKRHNHPHTQQNSANTRNCNCRRPARCPTDGKCLTKSVVYQAEVTTTDNIHTYIGVTGKEFKTRYRNHIKSLRHIKHKNETELSKHVWKLKTENRPFTIKWTLLKQIPAGGTRKCKLCLEEKLMIMKGRKKNLLNKRSELFCKCRHVTRYLR